MSQGSKTSPRSLRGVLVRVTASTQAALFLTPLLVETAGRGVKIQALDSGVWSLQVWIPERRWNSRAACHLHEACSRLSRYFFEPSPPTVHFIQQDSFERFGRGEKRFFRPFQATDRLWVTPPGRRDYKAKQQKVLELEIGKARGTGIHPATRSCLRLLQHVTDMGPTESALDLGTGSGILALAAARFGIRQTLALDVDPHSVGVARRNVRRNALNTRVKVRCLDVVRVGATFPLVMAQRAHGTFSHPTRRGALMRCLAPEGWLILGGIWWTRRNEFLASLVPHLQLVKEDREAWWGAFLLRKN